MRFDVPLVSAALLGGANAAAYPPVGYRNFNRYGFAELEKLESEIQRLEGQLEHDLKALQQWQSGWSGQWQNGGPPPYAASSSASASASAASAASVSAPASLGTSAAPSHYASGSNYTTSVAPITSYRSPEESSSALASASSALSSVSSQASFVSCIYETATSSPSSSLIAPGYSADSTKTTTFQETTTVISVGTVTYTIPYTPTTTPTSKATTSEGSPAGYTSAGSLTAGHTSAGSSEEASSAPTAPAYYPSSAASSAASAPAGYTSVYSAPDSFASGSGSVPAVTVTVTFSSSVAPYPYPGGNGTTFPSGSVPSGYAGTKTLSPPIVTAPGTTFTASFTTTFAPSVSVIVSSNQTSKFLTGTAAPTPSAALNTTHSSNTTDMACAALCSKLSFDIGYQVTPYSCQAYSAGDNITAAAEQAAVGCGTTFTAETDLCRVTLGITTSGSSQTFSEVWLPNANATAWNGRTMSTDNGGSNGCVAYDDMQYVTGMGFAAIGDNGGHNGSAFDAGWFYFENEEILDWVYRARHLSTAAGKSVVDQFYGQAPSYSYYLGCSTGGQQGLHSAQYYPEDFDGIIAGSAAADFNHLQGWSNRFVQLTGNSTDPRFLTEDQWILVQSYILDQCDAALDGVDDGIIEDPTICEFNSSAIPVCEGASNSSCLTSTQITTVNNVFTSLFNSDGDLLYPQMLYGSQVDAFRLGMLSGGQQAIAVKWYGGGVYNDSYYDAYNMGQDDYAEADSQDELHGNVSGFNGDLSAFHAAGGKLLYYHGMADPLVSGGNSQRYYLKVAKTMGLDNTGLDEFMRYFRISGMAHCGVGGISGAGAWMFGQNGLADPPGVADNVIWNMVDWVEKGNAPDVIVGTKFWYDETDLGIEFERPHCRFPYRTTYKGSGDWTDPSNWTCDFIDDWQECGVGAHPRLCNADGTFDP